VTLVDQQLEEMESVYIRTVGAFLLPPVPLLFVYVSSGRPELSDEQEQFVRCIQEIANNNNNISAASSEQELSETLVENIARDVERGSGLTPMGITVPERRQLYYRIIRRCIVHRKETDLHTVIGDDTLHEFAELRFHRATSVSSEQVAVQLSGANMAVWQVCRLTMVYKGNNKKPCDTSFV
jgi:hypothetical protein